MAFDETSPVSLASSCLRMCVASFSRDRHLERAAKPSASSYSEKAGRGFHQCKPKKKKNSFYGSETIPSPDHYHH